MKKTNIIAILVVSILMLLSTVVRAETQIPTFKLVGGDAQRGGTIEAKLVVTNSEPVTSAGITIQYDKRLEVVEVKAANSYIVKENVDKDNGKITIAFSGNPSTEDYTFEREICTIKYKIPKDFPDNTETKLEITSAKDVFSATEYINQYYDEAGTIKVSGNYRNTKAIIFGGACVIFAMAVLFIIIILARKKK
jgi:hypothetical protein